MNEWRTKHIDLGDISVNEKQTLTFHAKGDLINIVSLKSSCGCSKPKQKGNSIVVSYTPTAVPKHLQEQGFYNTTKKVTLRYADGSQDVLSFTAKVFKK